MDPLFEEVYRCNKDEITGALAKGEWTVLRPEMRLKLLVWLTDAVTICETVRARVADVATPVLSADAPFEPAPAEEQDYYRRRRGDQPEKWPLAVLAAMPVKLED